MLVGNDQRDGWCDYRCSTRFSGSKDLLAESGEVWIVHEHLVSESIIHYPGYQDTERIKILSVSLELF